MRLLLLLLAAALWASAQAPLAAVVSTAPPASASGPTFVSGGATVCIFDTASHASMTCPLSQNPTAGNALFIAFSYEPAVQSDCEANEMVSLSGGSNTYAQADFGTVTKSKWYGGCIAAFSAFSINGGALTITATLSGFARQYLRMAVLEIQGATAVDVVASAGSTGTTITSPSFSTAAAGELIAAAVAPESTGGNPYTAGAIGGVTATIPTGGSSANIAAEYREVHSIQSGITASMSWTGGTNAPMVVLSYR